MLKVNIEDNYNKPIFNKINDISIGEVFYVLHGDSGDKRSTLFPNIYLKTAYNYVNLYSNALDLNAMKSKCVPLHRNLVLVSKAELSIKI